MLTLQELTGAIIQRVEGRYDVCPTDVTELMLPEVEYNSHVVRLKRSHIELAGWRTVLLIELPLTALQAANQWAADVRDVLPEPETADLYMFLMISDISKDDAARIETDDRFCRKVVVRKSEAAGDFLNRTFLAALDPAGDVETLNDPLVSALNALSAARPWSAPHIAAWRAQLLTNKNGADVVRVLTDSLSDSEVQP
ncbi:ABC-three component system middle component 1 [Paraburkholderia tropica]|uniref:ABC-three component system middle component 1 n=1 Tax=Paraburkholderia tropica TaxID=92647 RepID=UPI002AB0B549|nr:ABC-three component system middle component 1 [Paraburkholderia tropica]